MMPLWVLAIGTVASEPARVAIERHVVIETDWWIVVPTMVAAATSAAVALFTYKLALQTSALSKKTGALAEQTKRVADETAKLARETLDSVNIARTGSEIADMHHQESQSPVLVFQGGPHLIYNSATSSAQGVEMNILGGLLNVGFGVALDVVIIAEIESGKTAAKTIGIVNISNGIRDG